MIAKVTLLGRVGREPECATSKGGTAYARFTVATDTGYGEQRRTSWWSVTAFGKTAEYAAKSIHKGAVVFIEGDISDNEYTDKQGNPRKDKQVAARTVQNVTPRQAVAAAVAEEDATDWLTS